MFTEGAAAIDNLTSRSKVLIAEACTHAPLEEDIGREKIPRMLRKRFGENLQIHMAAGSKFPSDLSEYDLIIHCGACMFNRRHVLSRISEAQAAGVPITNYGKMCIRDRTGSRMDDVIFEEFKGTGNMELHLDRKLSEKRIFPAIDLNKSGTRREDLLMNQDELGAVWAMRRALSNGSTQDVTETIIDNLAHTKNNRDFIQVIRKVRLEG